MKILLMKFRNIGDVLLLSPVIKNLKLAYPNSTIDVALNSGTKEMMTLNPNVNNIIIYDRGKIKSFNILKRVLEEIKFALKIRINKYDIVVNTTEGDRGTQIALLSDAKIKIGYKNHKNRLLKNVFTHNLPSQELRHTLEMNLDVLRVLNLPIKEKKVEIFWSKEDEKRVDKLLACKKFIHVHPVSRWLFKCLNDKIVASIIDYCEIELKIRVVLTSAPIKQELDRISSILKLCKSEPVNLSGKLTLKQTACLNKKADFFIGVDTAIMHISAANDIPVLAFFGPSGADHWGPWDNDMMKSGYTTRRGFRSMGKHKVIQENWDCIPCGKDGCNGTKISDCLMSLDMNFIEKNIKEMTNG
ncbi:MAG: putative lipopolysaccharide heptosyltransferase III [Epsilonproteobacteria bacterium]|nr:putative lipopolysaccharide heptosyltransferase III [Campylobacterota bacterium]